MGPRLLGGDVQFPRIEQQAEQDAMGEVQGCHQRPSQGHPREEQERGGRLTGLDTNQNGVQGGYHRFHAFSLGLLSLATTKHGFAGKITSHNAA